MHMRRALTAAFTLVIAPALAATLTGTALADASADLEKAALTTLQQHSYHISVTSPGSGTSEGDVVNPGRVHISVKGIEMIDIGTTMYMKQPGKPWTKYSGGGMEMNQADLIKKFAGARHDFTAADLGMRVVGGTPLHAYSVTNNKTHAVQTVFIDAGGRMARVESSGMVMRFTNFNEAVTINAPI